MTQNGKVAVYASPQTFSKNDLMFAVYYKETSEKTFQQLTPRSGLYPEIKLYHVLTVPRVPCIFI